MSSKGKMKLIIVSICIIIGVLSINVLRGMKEGYLGGEKEEENVITLGEAYRLLSYIEYDRAGREAIPDGIVYANKRMSGWYDTYVNAVWKMGLIEGNVNISPKKALTYGTCKGLVDKLIIRYPDFQEIYGKLSFGFINADKKMLIPEFLEIYEAILDAIPKEERLFQEKTLFVLGRDITEDGIDRMVTDQGKFYYQDAKSYEIYYEQIKNKIADQEKQVDGAQKASGNQPEAVQMQNEGTIIDQYLDKGICAYICGQELIYVSNKATGVTVLHNVWIVQGKNSQIDTFLCGLEKRFDAKHPLSEQIAHVVGDITIENGQIAKISVKPDMISGKVLQTGDDFIEIKGYGKIPLEQDYKIYKVYGELSIESTNSILVGYETTDFVVSEGKISAALIRKTIQADKIRVLLKTNNHAGIYHESVTFTANRKFTVMNGKNTKSYEAGDKVTVKRGNKLLTDGRMIVETASDKGKIQLLSLERSYGNPKYRGKIEIADSKDGLLLVNELSLEEYLYAVIPSEMPTSYGVEALKVQAVCARSYAYQHLIANSLSQYGAHVDDSVSYQVYNNISENEDSILAVKDTYGKVIKYGQNIITAYYFSTSCGHTTAPECVWYNGKPIPYLVGKLMTDNTKAVAAQKMDQRKYQDLSNEKVFRKFLKDKRVAAYDSNFGWFRWHTTMNLADIRKVIDDNLQKRYQANPNLILTMTSAKKGKKKAVFESIPVETVGDIVDISVSKRETGGIISELIITGRKNTIKIKTEYNVRQLLAPVYSTVVRKDLSKVENLTLLPSAFFVVDRNEEEGQLKSITLSGGGYGHGVGMSQNAVKGMIEAGKSYEEVLSYFYEGTEIGAIYN